jgi:hypothetical protein
LTKREDSKVGLDVALRELDRYQAMTEREKLEFNLGESKYYLQVDWSPTRGIFQLISTVPMQS